MLELELHVNCNMRAIFFGIASVLHCECVCLYLAAVPERLSRSVQGAGVHACSMGVYNGSNTDVHGLDWHAGRQVVQLCKVSRLDVHAGQCRNAAHGCLCAA